VSAGAPSVKSRAQLIGEIERLLAQRAFPAAHAAALRLAITGDEDAELQALVAWTSIHGGEAADDALRAAVVTLNRSIGREPDCARAHYYRGVLNKRLGATATAVRDFTRAVRLEPTHVDAQRELMILERRARKSGSFALDGLLPRDGSQGQTSRR
jgi:hypothetical protein